MKTGLNKVVIKGTMILCFYFIVLSVVGQRQTFNQNNAWYMYFGNHRLSEKLLLHTEYQFRRSGIIKDWQQSLARIGIDYKLNKQLTITAGYGHIRTFAYGELPVSKPFTEHRIWQTLTINQFFNGWILNHRYRLEQRWIESTSSDRENTIYRNRIRYRAMATIPLTKKSLDPGTIFISIYDELFIGFGENVAQAFDQNRIYFAVGHQFNSSGNVQLGYLNQLALKSDGINQEQNHTLMLGITYNLDLRK